MNSDIINNINLDLLPDNVQNAMLLEFKQLSLDKQYIIYARIVHGVLFKCQRIDLFKINNKSASKLYDEYINSVKIRIENES